MANENSGDSRFLGEFDSATLAWLCSMLEAAGIFYTISSGLEAGFPLTSVNVEADRYDEAAAFLKELDRE